jgi:hypothetical protein
LFAIESNRNSKPLFHCAKSLMPPSQPPVQAEPAAAAMMLASQCRSPQLCRLALRRSARNCVAAIAAPAAAPGGKRMAATVAAVAARQLWARGAGGGAVAAARAAVAAHVLAGGNSASRRLALGAGFVGAGAAGLCCAWPQPVHAEAAAATATPRLLQSLADDAEQKQARSITGVTGGTHPVPGSALNFFVVRPALSPVPVSLWRPTPLGTLDALVVHHHHGRGARHAPVCAYQEVLKPDLLWLCAAAAASVCTAWANVRISVLLGQLSDAIAQWAGAGGGGASPPSTEAVTAAAAAGGAAGAGAAASALAALTAPAVALLQAYALQGALSAVYITLMAYVVSLLILVCRTAAAGHWQLLRVVIGRVRCAEIGMHECFWCPGDGGGGLLAGVPCLLGPACPGREAGEAAAGAHVRGAAAAGHGLLRQPPRRRAHAP